MKIVGIIPARYASTRLPGKPLIDIGGKSMIERVYNQVSLCPALHEVIVATDDERIEEHIKSFGGNVVLTSPYHQSGTDRCGEAAKNLGYLPDVVLNIQGDEPFIDPLQISRLAQVFITQPQSQIVSLYKVMNNEADAQNPNTVKVVTDISGAALYFSRNVIPYRRSPMAQIVYKKHIGIYGYRMDVLNHICSLKPSELEIAESLEQLRWIENGLKITMCQTEIEGLSIDTPDDLKLVENYLKK
jgi:3-deoxy-manno-octulosonate cytidylyltransferase (CMP-KDO synthetase)